MGAQTVYSFNAQSGSAGGILDLAPHETNTFINGMATGDMHVGHGVFLAEPTEVKTKLNNCVLPNIEDGYGDKRTVPTTDAEFLGVTVNNRTTELGHFQNAGKLVMHFGAGCGVMRWGRVYVYTVFKDMMENKNTKYGDALYVVVDGDEDMIGKFTNVDGSATWDEDLGGGTTKTHTVAATVKVNGKFVSRVDPKANVAMIEIFNQANNG